MVVLDLVLALGLALIAISLGRRLFAIFHFKFASFAEEAVFSFALGLGVLAYVIFLLGTLGWLYQWVFYGLVALLVVLLHRELLSIARSMNPRGLRPRLEGYSLVTLALAGVLLFTLLLNLIGTLAPTTEADSLSYHFALPKQFIREHGIIYIPDWYANTPLTQHMLYTLGMGLRQDTLPALINYLEGLALVVSVLLFCRKYLSLQIGLLAALLLYTMPQLTYMTGSGIVESGLTLFTFLAFWAFYEWLRNREIRWLVIIGMFVGFAIGTKYYGLISFVAFGSVLGLHLILSHGIAIRELVKTLVIFCAIAAIIGSPCCISEMLSILGTPSIQLFMGSLGAVTGVQNWTRHLISTSPRISDRVGTISQASCYLPGT